jgi:hypothetical protein
LKEVLDCFELTDGCLLGITIDNSSSNYWMTRVLQSTYNAAGILWPAMRSHIAWMADVIQLRSVGVFMSGLGVKCCNMSWSGHKHDQQFGENQSTDIGKRQRLRKKGNA